MCTTTKSIICRDFAHPLDQHLKNDSFDEQIHTYDAGCTINGVGWYEHFRDRRTGEIYRVYCYCGVYVTKKSYSSLDEYWLNTSCLIIAERITREVSQKSQMIQLSRNEWIVMQKCIHVPPLDLPHSVQTNDSINNKLIGHIQGIPIIIDPGREDELPLR